MMKQLLVLGTASFFLSGCDLQRAMECNKQAIEMSTCSIMRNTEAIEQSNEAIRENQEKLSAVTSGL